MEKNENYRIIGMMSGTSLDGLDIALCEFNKQNLNKFRIILAETVNYDDQLKGKLQNCFNYSARDFCFFDAQLGKYFGQCLNNFLSINNIDKKTIDAIASHGHTVFHEPNNGFTTQIGSLSQIAAITESQTIGDFRSLDVSLGGQGAPLVPIGDRDLFTQFDACLNLGGIGNVSFTENNSRVSYDVCVTNIANNYLCNQLGLAFDNKGNIAKSGQLNDGLFRDLNDLTYFKQSYPKSLGIEFFLEKMKPIIDDCKVDVSDKLCTLAHHIAFQVGKSLEGQHNCLVTGGGTFNEFWIQQIRSKTNCNIQIPSKEIIEFKEALIFAYLGVLKLKGGINTLSSVTGARKDSTGGIIFTH